MKSTTVLLLSVCILTSMQTVADASIPTENFSLNYETIKHSKNNLNNISAGAKDTKKLKCKRVSRRISVCGSSNFKNKIVGGIGIHFSKADQTGSLAANTPPLIISEDINSCENIKQDESISPAQIQVAINGCKIIIENHNLYKK